jgi:hypothetical protein
MIVFVPVSKGMPEAIQRPTPVAVPVAPPDVCQVTRVTPAPPDAVPASEIVAALTVSTTDAGEVIATATGALGPLVAAGEDVITAVCDAASRTASKAVTVTVLESATSGIALAVQTAGLAEPALVMDARPL